MPAPLFFLLALAPGAIAWVTLRRLDEERPADEQGVLRVAASVAGGFVITSWVLALVTAQQTAIGSPRSAFGLALLWALAGAGVAAAVWTQRHGVRWQALQATGTRASAQEAWEATKWTVPDAWPPQRVADLAFRAPGAI